MIKSTKFMNRYIMLGSLCGIFALSLVPNGAGRAPSSMDGATDLESELETRVRLARELIQKRAEIDANQIEIAKLEQLLDSAERTSAGLRLDVKGWSAVALMTATPAAVTGSLAIGAPKVPGVSRLSRIKASGKFGALTAVLLSATGASLMEAADASSKVTISRAKELELKVAISEAKSELAFQREFSENALFKLIPVREQLEKVWPGLEIISLQAVASQPDGQLLFAVEGPRGSATLVRVNDSAEVSSLSGITTGFNGAVRALEVQADGKILVGGDFTSFNGSAAAPDRFIRLNDDGSIDYSGSGITTGFNGAVKAIVAQDDGSILVFGDFISYNGIHGAHNVIRLKSDLSIDSSFRK